MAYESKNYKTKEVASDSSSKTTKATKSTSTKQTRLYHFAGGGVYKPLSVEATSRAEAEKKWEQQRIKQ